MIRSDHPDPPLHPTITTIEDTLTFKIARFAAINARDGTIIFRDAFAITLNEWRVLGLVAAHAPLGLQELSRRVVMDKGQLSHTVASLVARGTLISHACPNDARKVQLTLTDTGAAQHARVLDFACVRNEEVLAPLSTAEAQTFMTLLDRLLDHNVAMVEKSGHL